MSLQQQNHGVCGDNDMCLLIFDDDDGEIITVDENKDDVDNSIATKRKEISILNKWKRNHRRSTASIILTDHHPVKASRAVKMSTSLPTINESRNDVDVEERLIMLPDDMSESSFNVLKRYMGCSSVPYGTRRSTLVTRDRDDSDIRVDTPSKEAVKDVKSTQPPSPPLTQTRGDIEDDTLETSSLDVLMKYIGCAPISYRDHKQHSTTTIISSQVDETGNRDEISSTNLSHIYGSCEIDDSNSLLSDNDYDEEESIDDVTPEQRHELLIEVIKEMIAGSNNQAERNVDTSTRREEGCQERRDRDTVDDDQKEEDTEMKSVKRMSSPRKILFKRLLAKSLHGKGKKY